MAWLSVFSALALLLTGCAYKLGPTTGEAAGARSMTIMPFVNRTLEPRLGDAVTQSLRKQMQRDGTFRLDTKETGDIMVTGTVVDYQRNGVSFQPTDVLTMMDYNLTITVQVHAVERSSGRVLVDRTITGYTLLRVSNDLTSSERQGLPQLADNVCRNITTVLADGTW